MTLLDRSCLSIPEARTLTQDAIAALGYDSEEQYIIAYPYYSRCPDDDGQGWYAES